MKVVTVKFGGVQGGVDGHKISFSLGTWFSCDEQKVRQEDLFFNLGCIGQEAIAAVGGNCLRRGGGPFHRRQVLGGGDERFQK